MTYDELVKKYIKDGNAANSGASKGAGDSPFVGNKTDKSNNGDAKSVKKSKGKKNNSISINALGAGDYGASKNTRTDNVLRASGTSAAGAIVYLKGLLDEIDAQTKARDEADSARLKAGRDAAEQGIDINTADGGLKKAHEEQQKDFETRAAKYAGVGEDEFKRAQELYAKSAEHEAKAKEGLGKVGQFAVDLGIAGTQFAGDVALNAILPGAGLAAMGARAAGQGAYSASLEGKDINEQLTSGLKSAAVEVLTEKLFGLGSKVAYGAGLVKNKNLVNSVVNRLAKTDKGRTALKLLVGASEEGLEEVLSDVLNPVADRLLKLDDGKGDWSDLGDDMDVEQMLSDYLLGAALGLAGSGANIANGSFSAENKSQRDKEAYQRALVDSGLESAEGTKSRELAEKADKILSKSGKRGGRYLTDKEVEALREANIEAIAAEEAAQTAQEAAKPRAASDVVADVAAGKTGAQEPTQQATSAPTMEQVVAAMTGKPIAQAAPSNVKASFDPNSANWQGDWFDETSSGHNSTAHLNRELLKVGVDAFDMFDGMKPLPIRIFSWLEDVYRSRTISAESIAKAVAQAYAGEIPDNLSDVIIRAYEIEGKPMPDYIRSEYAPTVEDEIKREKENVSYQKGQAGYFKALAKQAERNGNKELAKKYYEQEKECRDRAKQSQNAIKELEALQATQPLPQGMGAASAEFTGEMSPAEQWVAEAQAQGDSALHPISDEQQRNLAEQQYRAPQELPKIDPMGNLTSKTAQTVMNSGVTPQEMSDAILNDAYDGRFSRIAYTDSEAINKAEDEIENGEGRYQGALSRWKGAVDRGEVSKDNIVMGICLYNNAVTNGDYTTALDILDGLVFLGKNTGQALQAVRILNKLSPEGRLYVAAKAVDRINAEVKKRYGDKAPDISVDEGLYADYCDALKSGDEAKIKSAWEAVEQNIADQIPASWADKLNAWRYLAMLGNLRTHARNFFGNAGFMPIRVMKNYLAAGIESAVDKVSKDGIARTKAALNPLNANDKALLAVAWQDYQNVKDAIMSGGKYNDNYDGVLDKRTIFTSKIGKPVEVLSKANTRALNAEDSWFSQPAYAESLAEYLKANGISAQQYTTEGAVAPEVIAAAQAYAVKEAQKATYRDINKFSQFVSKLGKTNIKAVNLMVEAILPFKKTPANILARAVEYSPVGLAKTLSADIISLKNGKITAAEFIDSLSSGLVGTALVGLGILLAKHGVLLGGADDDDEQQSFNELRGKQSYSINIGDATITLDWLAPESMPLFVGVALWESLSDNERDGNALENAFEAISNVAMPIFDMSMLQGVNDLLEGLRYVSDGKGIMKLLVDAAANYLSQYIPTLGGQIERIIETQREQTFIDRSEDASSSAVQYKLGSILNKIPGIDYNQIPYIDAWGRTEDTGSFAERAFNNFINPAYVKKSGETWVDDELQRLYDLGETGVFPQKAAQDTKINGEYLSADEYVAYAQERGSVSLEGVQELIRSSAYKNMSDADKAAAIKNVYAYADGMAKLKVNRKAEVESWVSKAKDSGNPSQYITDRIYLNSVDSDGNGSSNSADKVRGLINGGYSGNELISKVREYMTSESGNCELADLLEKTQSANVDDNIALDVYEFKKSSNNDKNADGKVTKSVKDKVKEYIGSLSIPADQKNALYYSLYKEW